MKSVVKAGKTVEEALELALSELKVEREDVSIEILEEPSKGLFGFIGTKDAKVKVTVTNDPVSLAEVFLNSLLQKMNIEATVLVERKENDILVDIRHISSSDKGILIGKRGNTLDSLQYLLSLTINKGRQKYLRVLVDIENYREKREETLIRLAQRMADRVKNYRKTIKLEPMNPYERRIIHSALQNDSKIRTYSVGEEPYRRVVIEFKY